jgi:hypothetical protein
MGKRTWWVMVMVGALVLGLAAPAAAAPAEFPYLGREIVVSAIDNVQHLPAAAYNWKHDEYLVVWHNEWGGGGTDIYAQRVTSGGQLRSWFNISGLPHSEAQPSVAYDPVHDRYLVVWAYDILGDGSDWDIVGRFIPWEGPDPGLLEFGICNWSTHQREPQVVYARAMEEFLVVWNNEYQTGPLPMYVSGQRIGSSDGQKVDNAWTIFTHGTEDRTNADVAYNLARNEYLVVCDNGVDIIGKRLTGNGQVLGPGEVRIAGWPDAEVRPAVAACREADQYLVVWESYRPLMADLFARFITGDGTPESVHEVSALPPHEFVGDVVCNEAGREYLVTYQLGIYEAICGRLISPDKTLHPDFEIAASPGHVLPAAAGGESNFLVVWQYRRSVQGWEDIHGRLVAPYAAFLPVVVRNRRM